MKQVEVSVFPSGMGWCVVELRWTAEEVNRRNGIAFADDLDDLGEFKYAALHSPSVGQIYLEQRPHPVFNTVSVTVDLAISRSDAVSALALDLGWDARDFAWITPWDMAPMLKNAAQMRPWPDTRQTHANGLSRREAEVLSAAADGFSTRDIAGRLQIAPSTVSGHLQRIYLKLGVHSLPELREMLRRYPQLARSA